MRRVVPRLEHAYGPYLDRFLALWIFACCRPDDVPDFLLPRRVYRLLPRNPIVIAPDGSLRDWRGATLDDFRQVLEAQPRDDAHRPAGGGTYRDSEHFQEKIRKAAGDLRGTPRMKINATTLAKTMALSRAHFHKLLVDTNTDWRNVARSIDGT